MKSGSAINRHPEQCPLGLTSKVLSTWLGGGLDEQESQKVSTHVSECRACQIHLAAYDMVDSALNTQPVPQPSDALWSLVQQRLLRAEQRGHARRMLSGWRSPVGMIATLAAILLLAIGFFQLFHSRSANTLAPANLTWSKVSFPAGSVLAYGHTMAVSQSDGNTAYVCSITSSRDAVATPTGSDDMRNGTAAVWVSHDRAANWSQTHALPAMPHAVNACYVVVDDYQPSTALAVVSWSQIPGPQLSSDAARSYVTTDGGASWQTLSDPRSLGIVQLATIKGRTYALANLSCNQQQPITLENDCIWHLYAISDAWQAWQPIDQIPTQESHPIGARGFWGDPDTGAIWESALIQGTTTDGLWETTDGGAHWHQLATPAVTFFKGWVSAGKHFIYLCGFKDEGSGSQKSQVGPFQAYCSSDGGANWHERPLLNVPSKNGRAALLGIAVDGSIFEAVTDGNAQTLYRLPAAGTQWQSLGQLPGSHDVTLLYRAGTIWTLPDFPSDFTSNLTLKDTVYVAAYP